MKAKKTIHDPELGDATYLANYSPAPWSLGSSDIPVSGLSVHKSGQTGEHTTLVRFVSSDKYGVEACEAYANARLIAAAPEMLDSILALLDHGQDRAKAEQKARAIVYQVLNT